MAFRTGHHQTCKTVKLKTHGVAEDQPRLIKGIRRRDGIGEDQDTIASIRY